MARAEALGGDPQSLYERDFCLWLEQQAALLRTVGSLLFAAS